MEDWFFHSWMCPEHCTPTFWFRLFVIICGVYISLTYAVFSKSVHALRIVLKRIIAEKFPFYLGLVFALCALVHGAHAVAYIHQYSKLTLLVTYPLLCFSHTILIMIVTPAIARLKELKTPEDIKIILDESMINKKKVVLLESLILKSVTSENIDSLKTYLKDGEL